MTTWPKQVPDLTPEQVAIRDDYMNYFYAEVYTARFGAIQRFNHSYAMRTAKPGLRTLDVGAGLGEHLEFEDGRLGDYVALELRPEMAAELARKYPYVSTVTGNVEEGLPFDTGEFDRVLAIHVLEHLRNLPAALDELWRVLRVGGVLSVVLPCEGGIAYSLGRRLTTQRVFEKRYGVSFDWCIKSEHVSVLREIVHELDARFTREHRSWWPAKLPLVDANVCVGLTYRRA
jgi:ubiquinone/menaquinone biosynthesis C-methylase UbiE